MIHLGRISILLCGALLCAAVPADDAYRDRVEAGVAFDQLLDLGEYELALAAAQEQLALAVDEFGEASAQTIEPRLDLGQVLLILHRYEEAEAAYDAARRLASAHGELFSPEIGRAYIGLGRAAQARGRHEQALGAFLRGQHVAHRQGGVYAPGQIPLLKAMAQSYLALDKREEAESMAQLVLRIHQEGEDFDTYDKAMALSWLGHWYGSQGDYATAMRLITRAMTAVEQRYGREDERLIPLLLARADIQRMGLAAQVRYSVPSPSVNQRAGLRDYRRAVALAETSGADVEQQIETRLALADWYLMINEPAQAHAEYERVWALVRDESERRGYWMRRLSVPQPIAPQPLLQGQASLEVDEDSQYQFAVGTDGRLRKIQELAQIEDRALSRAIMQLLRTARFRPRLIDGQILATEAVGFSGLHLKST